MQKLKAMRDSIDTKGEIASYLYWSDESDSDGFNTVYHAVVYRSKPRLFSVAIWKDGGALLTRVSVEARNYKQACDKVMKGIAQ